MKENHYVSATEQASPVGPKGPRAGASFAGLTPWKGEGDRAVGVVEGSPLICYVRPLLALRAPALWPPLAA